MPDCNTCKSNRPEPVPYLVHEEAMARSERTIKRLTAIAIVLAVLLAGTIAGFLIYLSQYDFTGYSYDQDGDVNVVGSRNGVNYNGTESQNPYTNFEEPLPGEGSSGPQS